MKRSILKKTVRMALENASGKPLAEAVDRVVEYLELLDINIQEDGSVSVLNTPTSPGLFKPEVESLASDVETIPPQLPTTRVVTQIDSITDLAPIDPDIRPGPAKVREMRTLEDIQDRVLAESPDAITIRPDGLSIDLVLHRMISQMTGYTTTGILLGYSHSRTEDSAMPYPRKSFWTTDASIDVRAAVAEIRKQALDIYKVRRNPVRVSVTPRALTFDNGAEVS